MIDTSEVKKDKLNELIIQRKAKRMQTSKNATVQEIGKAKVDSIDSAIGSGLRKSGGRSKLKS